jgi:hypothetical protein
VDVTVLATSEAAAGGIEVTDALVVAAAVIVHR